MFTGIVQACVPVVAAQRKPGLTTLTLEFPEAQLTGLRRSASVAVDGVCLTVIGIDGPCISFDIMEETLQLTTLGGVDVGDMVNIERAAAMGAELGGHEVSGHVHGLAEIIAVERPENNHVVTFRAPLELMPYVFNKGFAALDGVSLTLVDVYKKEGTFRVFLIPETLTLTTFGFKEVGDSVNLEIDVRTQAIVDTVERVLAEREP